MKSSPVARRPNEAEPQPSALSTIWSGIREFLIVSVIAIVTAALVKQFLMQTYYIPSESMENTLVRNDRIAVSRLSPTINPIQRGDVIVFRDPGGWIQNKAELKNPQLMQILTAIGIMPQGPGEHVIKRVIGLPGDRVECCGADGRIKVNGVAITETYLKPGVAPSETTFDVVVPEGHYWVMGDNRPNSGDSRAHRDDALGGTIPQDRINGRAIQVFWPLSRWAWLGNYEEVFIKVPPPGQEPAPRTSTKPSAKEPATADN